MLFSKAEKKKVNKVWRHDLEAEAYVQMPWDRQT